MSENNSPIGNSASGLRAPVKRHRVGGQVGSVSGAGDGASRLPEQGRPAAPQRDPYNLRAAFDRLAKLLTRDGDSGPRSDAPPRGFYLNILV